MKDDWAWYIVHALPLFGVAGLVWLGWTLRGLRAQNDWSQSGD